MSEPWWIFSTVPAEASFVSAERVFVAFPFFVNLPYLFQPLQRYSE